MPSVNKISHLLLVKIRAEASAKVYYTVSTKLREEESMADQGLGSPNMDESKKKEIQKKGGEATGGKNLSRADRARGGKHSHDNQNTV